MKRTPDIAALVLAVLLTLASVALSSAGDAAKSAPAKRGAGVRQDAGQGRAFADLPRARLESRTKFYRVSRVVDGDTFRLDNEERVRLIGVDTPETKHPKKPIEYYGPEASAFTKKQIEKRLVRLEVDRELRDYYGRILAYVFRRPDEFFLNAELIRQGYGYAYTRYPFSRRQEFLRFEEEAKKRQRGLWAPRPPDPAPGAVP